MWHASSHKRLIARLYVLAIALALLGLVLIPYRSLSTKLAEWLWARGHLTAAYYLNYDDANLAMEEGFYYFGGGAYDLDKATKAFQLALSLEPGALWGHYELARIYYVQGNLSGAMQEINAELAANPANLRSLYERGLIETSQGNLAAAEADFKRFVQWAPTEWGGYNDGAFVLAKEGKYAESETMIEEAFKQVPDARDVPWLWNSLGLAQLNELEYTQAQTSFGRALALALTLTPEEWVRAYSANDPAAASTSIANFKAAIEANLKVAQAGFTI